MTLSNSIENRTVVITENLVGFDFANFARDSLEIIREKIFDANFANKANTHGFFLSGNV